MSADLVWTMPASMRAVLRSLVPVICPAEAHGLAEAILDHMTLTLAASPAMLRIGLAAGLVTYDLGALPRFAKRARSLDPARAETYFASWEHGFTPIHVQLARGINQLMSLSCYEMPAMMERLGYRPGPWIDEVNRKRLTVHREAITKQDRQVIAPDPLRPGAQVGSQRSRRRAAKVGV